MTDTGLVTWERFEAVCKQLSAREAEVVRLRRLLKQALPSVEALMPLARDDSNEYYKWVPGWVSVVSKLQNGNKEGRCSESSCNCE